MVKTCVTKAEQTSDIRIAYKMSFNRNIYHISHKSKYATEI